jgi:hypothetical protein
MSGAGLRRREVAQFNQYVKSHRRSATGGPGRPLAAKGPVGLWQLAGRIYHEAIFQGSLSAAGSNKQRLVERMDNNSDYIKRQARIAQIMGSFYLLFVVFLSASSLVELKTGTTHEWNLFVAAIAGTIQLVVQAGYLMILTLLATSEILAPDLYRWPESLPLRAEQSGMLRVMALAREFLLPLSVIVVIYPIVAGVHGGIGTAAATLGISVFHAIFTLSLTVLASWRLRRTLRAASGNDRRATTVRVFTMASYGLGILFIIGIMQFGTSFIASLFDEPRLTASESLGFLRVAALLPLPTSAATLVGALVARHASLVTGIPLWMPLVGTGLYGVASLLMLRAAWRLIGQRESEGPVVQSTVPEGQVALVVRTARAAFRRQIFQTATRDTQMLLALLIPLVIPLAILAGPSASGTPIGVLLYVEPIMVALFGSSTLVLALSRLQAGTGLLEASLPILERDRAFPRLMVCAIFPAVGALIAGLILMPAELKLQAAVLSTVPAIAVPVGFMVKTALFGRIPGANRSVVVEEVYLDHRALKWVGILASVLAVAGGLIGIQILGSRIVPGNGGLGIYFAAAAVSGAVVRFIAGREFPAATRT